MSNPISFMSTATSFIRFHPDGSWMGPGFTPDGTVPSDGIVCTDAVAAASGPWTTAVNGAIVLGVKPAPSLAVQANSAIMAGITIVSTSAPALNGIYACDPAAQAKILATDLFITKNASFYGGAATYPWVDLAGSPHIFPSIVEFGLFATAVANYVAALDAVIAGQSETLPSSTVTIA